MLALPLAAVLQHTKLSHSCIVVQTAPTGRSTFDLHSDAALAHTKVALVDVDVTQQIALKHCAARVQASPALRLAGSVGVVVVGTAPS
jgi:hypothetical protein